ncbi:hypothetical protein Tco_0054102 [Tanacetum coccineum]
MLDFAGLTYGMRQTLGDRLSMVYVGDDGQAVFTSHAWRRLFEVRGSLVREFILEFLSTCRMSDTEMGLDVAGLHYEEEMAEPGFGAYWSGSKRVITDKGDLRDYWMEISSDRDFLGSAPSYVYIRDPRRKSRARLFGGYFIGRLTAHFGLVSDQGLSDLSVVVSELPVIDLHELGRLNISAEGALAADEGAQGVPVPVQEPQPPPPAPQPRTMSQRIDRLEEEVREMR